MREVQFFPKQLFETSHPQDKKNLDSSKSCVNNICYETSKITTITQFLHAEQKKFDENNFETLIKANNSSSRIENFLEKSSTQVPLVSYGKMVCGKDFERRMNSTRLFADKNLGYQSNMQSLNDKQTFQMRKQGSNVDEISINPVVGPVRSILETCPRSLKPTVVRRRIMLNGNYINIYAYGRRPENVSFRFNGRFICLDMVRTTK